MRGAQERVSDIKGRAIGCASGAGRPAPLGPKGNFRRIPHLAELTGLAARLVREAPDFAKALGLQPIEAVEAREVQTGSPIDPAVDQFLAECVTQAPGERVQASSFHALFVAWCVAHDRRIRSSRHLGQQLTRRGFVRLHSDFNWYLNVQLSKGRNDFVRPGEGGGT